MKTLEDFADEINKCSKCGLCQSVCPVYKVTGNDCAVSRGKFVMLDGVLKGDLKLNKTIEKYLDMCLKCGKCKNFCPSGIDVCEIFNTAKYACTKNTFRGKFEKFFESKYVFRVLLSAGNILAKILSFLKNQKNKTYRCCNVNIGNNESVSKRNGKLLYFKGCVNNMYPKTETSLKKVFSYIDVEIIEKDFDCCGLPFLSSGNMERYEEAKNRNLELLDCEVDYVLTDCASCEYTLKNYESDFSSKSRGLQKGKSVKKFINAAEFLSEQNIRFKFNNSVKLTFHKPCHLENDSFLKPLLAKCENVEYIEMKNYDECCGFAGEFAIKNHKISKQISVKKAENAAVTGADIILTTCPACVLGLKQGFIFSGRKALKVMNIMEFLASADEISSAED